MSNDMRNQATWARVDGLEAVELLPGITARMVPGDHVMLCFVTIAPGAEVPPHAHPHEQGGTVLRGTLLMTIDGETREIGPGDAYLIPGGVEHGATSTGDICEVLDVFSPPREDYLARRTSPTGEGGPARCDAGDTIPG